MKDSVPRPTVLVLGGDAGEQDRLGHALSAGFDLLTARSDGQLAALMAEHFVQVVVAIGAAGDWLDRVSSWPDTMLVAISDAPAPPDTDVQVVPAAWTPPQVAGAVAAASQLFQLRRENARLALEMRCLKTKGPDWRATRDRPGFEGIQCAAGSPMARVVAQARQFASFDVPVLLVGEPGTGKAELARAIHDGSLRSDAPFHTLDATGLSDDTIATALFGYRKAANGVPGVNKAGLARKAEQGTLFLAGIEALSHPLQMRLLRLVRDGTFEVDGAREPERSRVRVICAAGRDPQNLIADGTLAPALYYALSIAELAAPPLRARKVDLAHLAQSALEAASHMHGKAVKGFSDATLEFFRHYDWPGNLSELRNEVTRMLVRTQDPVLGPDVMSRRILQAAPSGEKTHGAAEIMMATGPLKDRVEAIEARILRETLTRLRWNKSRSAAELGLSRVGLRAKLDRYGITPPQAEEV